MKKGKTRFTFIRAKTRNYVLLDTIRARDVERKYTTAARKLRFPAQFKIQDVEQRYSILKRWAKLREQFVINTSCRW